MKLQLMIVKGKATVDASSGRDALPVDPPQAKAKKKNSG